MSSIASAIEIATAQHNLGYISAARILSIKTIPLGIPLKKCTAIPDQLLVIKHAEGNLSYALEVDSGMEPVRCQRVRKSLARSAMEYRHLIEEKRHRTRYGLKSSLLLLESATTATRVQEFRDFLGHKFKNARLALYSEAYSREDTGLVSADELLGTSLLSRTV